MRPFQPPAPLDQTRPGIGVLFILTAVVLVAALLLGGATREGHFGHMVVRLAAIPLLVLALVQPGRSRPDQMTVAAMALLGAAAVVALIHVVPLPPSLWTALPNREGVRAIYEAAGVSLPWLPLSLSPDDGLNAALALLPPAAVFLAVTRLDGQARWRLAGLTLIVVAVSALLGAAQLASGPESGLRLYEFTNPSSIGFFANRNHQAALLVVTLPLLTAWLMRTMDGRREPARLAAVAGIPLVIVLAASVAMTQSRAGFLLLVPALLGSGVLAYRRGRLRGRLGWLAMIAVGVASAAALLMASSGVLRRFDNAALDETRMSAAPVIARLSVEHLPLGSGLGSFDPVYRTAETASDVSRWFLNHAHNDYLELWLETGIPGVALIVLALAWWAAMSWRLWRPRQEGASSQGLGLARAASLGVGLLLLHSAADYPLRTTALAALFAFLCACMPPAPRAREDAQALTPTAHQ